MARGVQIAKITENDSQEQRISKLNSNFQNLLAAAMKLDKLGVLSNRNKKQTEASLKTLVTSVDNNTGRINNVELNVEKAQQDIDGIGQHFWHDEQGVHVSETERGSDGANMLLTSRKMEVRDGARGLISVSGFAGSTSVDYDEIASVEYFDGEAALATWRNISDNGELLGSVTDLRGKSVVRMTATSLNGGVGIDDWRSMFLGTVYGDGTPVAEMRVKSKAGGYKEAFMSVVGDEQLKKTQAFVKADEVFVKNVQIEPSGMSIAVGDSPNSLTTSKALVPLNVAGNSYGEGMYKSVGGCIGCNKSGIVRVSGQLYVSGGLTAGDRVYGYICRIDAKLNILSTNAYASTRAYGTYDIVVLPPVLVHVDAGDYLALYAQNYTGSRGNLSANSWSTYLTAEYVSLD